MVKPSQPLASFARNITSQNGEDGRWCLEVGAWDGNHLSNICQKVLRDRG
jgi:hypothetical protein